MGKELTAKHATVIPLIGGLSLGMEKATGQPPLFLASYGAFWKNDRHLVNHHPDIPYFNLDVPYWSDNLLSFMDGERPDIVGTVCPCAGLSVTSSQSRNHGAESSHNEWMYTSAEYVLSNLKPKVFWGENAPGLFGPKGRPVAEKLLEIGRKHGYAFSLIYTNTMLHGIPQNRKRCFYFFWRTKSMRAPRGTPIRSEAPSYEDFMRTVQYAKKGPALDRMEFGRTSLKEDIYYQFAVATWADGWRDVCSGRTIIDTLKRKDMLPQLFTFAETVQEHPQYLELKRHERNVNLLSRGLWDESPKVISEAAPTVMFKNVRRIVHPTEDRFLNVRELMALMGFPPTFQLHLDETKEPDSAIDEAMHHISQNVPVTTAADMTTYIMRVLDRQVPLSDSDFYMYDNTRGVRVIPDEFSQLDLAYEEE